LTPLGPWKGTMAKEDVPAEKDSPISTFQEGGGKNLYQEIRRALDVAKKKSGKPSSSRTGKGKEEDLGQGTAKEDETVLRKGEVKPSSGKPAIRD